MSILLFRTVSKDRKSYGGFQWGKAGEIVEAPDWDPDPNIDCGKGLHGVSNESTMGDYLDLSPNRILQVVEVEEGDYVLSSTKDKYRFKKGKVI